MLFIPYKNIYKYHSGSCVLVNNYNYPYSRNFIDCAIHVAFACGMFVFDLCILFCWHGMYIVVSGPTLCNVTPWMQINPNTSNNTQVNEIFPDVVFLTRTLISTAQCSTDFDRRVGCCSKLRCGLTWT